MRKSFWIVAFFLPAAFVWGGTPHGKGPGGQARSLKKSTILEHAYFDANRINATMMNNGQVISYWPTGNSGMEWPKGSGKFIDFNSGIWVVGKVQSTGEIRSAVAEYAVEFTPGKILPGGQPEDPSSPTVKWYKITRADLTNPSSDYLNWPFDQGAPALKNWNRTADSLDLLGNRIPALTGDQTLWCVFNDALANEHGSVFGTPPMGIEVQLIVWGYDRANAYADMMFAKATVIHKGTESFDSTFVALWDDPDVGDAYNDYVGCDTLLSLGFGYNGTNTDGEYGVAPPAIGRDFFQGPIVPATSSDTAYVSGTRIPGYRNLPLHAFARYINSGGYPYTDPSTALEAFYYMTGRYQDETRFVNPLTGQTTRFFFPGDPETNTGWTETNPSALTPDDRRFLMSSGPFTMVPGDTQEVVFAVLIAQGSSNVNSVSKLKENSILAQTAYDSDFNDLLLSEVTYSLNHPNNFNTMLSFQVKPPGRNPVQSAELRFVSTDGSEPPFQCTIYDDGTHGDGAAGDNVWGNSTLVANRKGPYRGDLVVQTAIGPDSAIGILPQVTARPLPIFQNWHVVWEDGYQDKKANPGETLFLGFDLTNPDSVNEVTTLDIKNVSEGYQTIYAPSIALGGTLSSDSLYLALYVGADDFEFYFEVSFDGHNHLYRDSAYVEGTDLHSLWGDTLEVQSIVGTNQWVYPIIADPSILTNHTYNIYFKHDSLAQFLKWSVKDETADLWKVEGEDISADPYHRHPVVDGIKFVIVAFEPGFTDFLSVSNAAGPLDPPEYAAFAFNASGFPHPTTSDRPWGQRQQVALASSLGSFGWGFNTDASGGLDYGFDRFTARVLRNDNPTRLSSYDWEIRFTSSPSKAWLVLATEAVIDVPFELWNIGKGTPDDPTDDYRVIPWVIDLDNNGQFNILANDHVLSIGDDDPQTDLIYFFNPVDTSPGSDGYVGEFESRGASYDGTDGMGHNHEEVMARLVLVFWNGGSVNDGTFPANLPQMMPEVGTVFRIVTSKGNENGDILQVVAPPAVSVSREALPVDFSLDQNFPNPFNPSTTIRFTLPIQSKVNLSIYDVLGRRIRTLADEDMNPGIRTLVWDGRAEGGNAVSSGVYFYQIKASGFVQTLRMVVIK